MSKFLNIEGKWQQTSLSFHLNETLKLYIEVLTEFLYLPYIVTYFD